MTEKANRTTRKRKKGKTRAKTKTKTYNSRDSHVVTHHTTNLPACGLSTAERTGSPVLHTLWSYVLIQWVKQSQTATTVYIKPTADIGGGAKGEEYGEI